MPSPTTALAAAALLVAGGAAGAALTAQADRSSAPARAAGPAPVEVRTEVVHRTVHVVRHVRPKPKHVAAAPPAPAAPAVTPVTARPVAASPARPASRPLRTRSSATGGEREDHGEGDGGERDD